MGDELNKPYTACFGSIAQRGWVRCWIRTLLCVAPAGSLEQVHGASSIVAALTQARHTPIVAMRQLKEEEYMHCPVGLDRALSFPLT